MARKLSSCTVARAVAAAPPADATAVAATAAAAVPVALTAAKCRLHSCLFFPGAVFLLLLLIQQQLAAALPFPNRKSSNTLITPDPSLASVSAAETAATAAESAAESAAAAPFLPTISTDRDLHEHDHEEQQQEDQQHERQLVPADASVSLLSSAATNDGRNYLCRNANPGGPCENRYDTTPDNKKLYCPPKECCSKTKCVRGQCSAFCSGSWALCSSWLIRFEEYSYGNCNCKRFGSKCPANSHCKEDNRPFAGVYCECNNGYVRDGNSCVRHPCSQVRCHPGACKLNGLMPYCTCPNGYEAAGWGVQSHCQLKSMCKPDNPCGDANAATGCATTGPLTYKCTCAAGYLVDVDPNTNKERCVKAELKIKCKDLPCGTEGLDTCKDTDNGYQCTCKNGYKLVETSSGKSCQLVDPCEKNVCGPPYAVLSCSSDANTYTCQCQEGFYLYTSTQNSAIKYCQPNALKETPAVAEEHKEEQDYSTYMMAGLGVGALGLAAAVAYTQRRRNAAPPEEPVEAEVEEHPAEEHTTVLAPDAGDQDQSVTPSPNSWA